MIVQSAPVTKNVQTDYSSWPLYSLFLLLLGTSVFPVEFISGLSAYFLLLAFFVWKSKKRSFPKSLQIVFVAFILMIAIGLVSGISNERYPYLKDAWYFINPVIVIFVGYCFGAQTPLLREGLRMVLIAGLILACFHLLKFVLQPNMLSMPATEVRALAGNGNFVVGLSVALLLARLRSWPATYAIPKSLGWLILVMCSASVYLAFSRTLVLVAIIFWIALRGLMVGSRFLKVFAVLTVGLVLLGSVAAYLPQATEMEKKTFSGKLLRSIQELTVADYQDAQSINDNFRGYETAKALKSYADGGPIDWLSGMGFGHFVDLGVSLALGDGPMRYIPVMHNGVMYVLVKTGALGLTLYLFCFGWLFVRGLRAASAGTAVETFAGKIAQGAVAILLFTSWLISGPFNKSALFSILLILGFVLSIVERKEWMK